MSRRLLRFVIGALLCLTCSSLAAGCDSEERAPFYVPMHRPQSARDAGVEAPVDAAIPPRRRVDGGGAPQPQPDAGERQQPDAGDGPQPAGCDEGPELRVLFIGNSHTYVNDVPALVRDLACAAGTKVTSSAVTPGGVSLIDHSTAAATLTAIDSDEWDVVVMQDQQLHPGLRLDDLEKEEVPAVQTLADAITTNRAATRRLFYMAWARRDGDTFNCDYYPLVCDFEGATRAVSEGYWLYVERTGGDVAPAALAWAAVYADTAPALPPGDLFNADGSHAALPGSYLAAAVLTGTMLGRETAELAVNSGLSEEVASYLREVADAIVSAQREDPRVMTAEQVRISCDTAGGCSDAADTKPVTITLSAESCADLAAGSAAPSGRIRTTASCRNGVCITVPLAGWRSVPGATIADGIYQVHVYIDVNDNGELDSGDLEACAEAQFDVGSGSSLTISQLTPR